MTGNSAALLMVLVAFAGSAAAAPPAARGGVVIRTEGGSVRGAGSDVLAFKGIPYAAPPVGALRWQAPAPVPHWHGVREATQFGNDCMQLPWVVSSGQPTSEDCLTVNVWSPPADRRVRRPVLVFIYGGGFIGGTGAYEVYDGSTLARDGAVVVSFNYRLGVLGFLAHPMLSAESAQHVSGNYGLLDQIAALHWVRRNIAAFGGDPHRVTVFGESAGGAAIASLMTSPLAAGLFDGAIIQSGEVGHMPTLAEAEHAGQKLAADIAELRGWSAEKLLQHNFDFFPTETSALLAGAFPSPTVDGVVLPEQPRAAFERGAIHKVAVLVGYNADEGRMFLPVSAITVAAYEAWVHDKFGARASQILKLAPAATDASALRSLSAVIGDGTFNESSRVIARGAARRSAATYAYLFTRAMAGQGLPATHSEELPYVFGTLDRPSFIPHPPPSAADWRLSAALRKAWVRFAASGNPNGGELPAWPVYDPGTDPYLEFGDEIRAGSGYRRAQLDLIEQIVAAGRVR